ncbi:MAG: hydrolase [Planctomycetaceae bacterium]|nr:hydrolase [Planctomycetaceae bacterium]
MSRRSPDLLDRTRSRLLIIDMQERLVPVMLEAATVTRRCQMLIQGANILGIPVTGTEQYPRGLGPTVPELRDLLGPCPDKRRFSCSESLPWISPEEVVEGRDQIVLAGIETHVCVLQTAFDLLAAGFRVYLAVDAVSSRSTVDRQVALDRMAAHGVTLTTVESILFEWCETADAAEFKQISQLVK